MANGICSPGHSTGTRVPSPSMSTKEQRERVELLQGTLDLLILRTLLRGPVHGHAIAKAIEFDSDDDLLLADSRAASLAALLPSEDDLLRSEQRDASEERCRLSQPLPSIQKKIQSDAPVTRHNSWPPNRATKVGRAGWNGYADLRERGRPAPELTQEAIVNLEVARQ